MSAKYQRIKQSDLALPAPLRWLTRAFSSITLAVTLLTFIALYGTLASVPIGMLTRGAMYGLVGAACLVPTALLAYRVIRGAGRFAGLAGPVRGITCLALVALAGGALFLACRAIYHWSFTHPFFVEHQATVIYRMPYFEMTELEFYNWWPMKVVLGLFVVNMIWATVRRIEFTFMNIGVLTVHTGIVTVAVGSIFYGTAKFEGDTLLFRRDLGGQPVNVFYDAKTAAVYFKVRAVENGQAVERNVMLELPDLPRYNDYDPGEVAAGNGKLNIRLHERGPFRQVLGEQLRATIPGLLSYAELQPVWVDAAKRSGAAPNRFNPALRLAMGDQQGPGDGDNRVILAALPAMRAIDEEGWALEYLVAPDPQRLLDLLEEFDGMHGLIVEIPALKFRKSYAIRPGQTIPLDDTGYTLVVEQIGKYGMAFATPGYQGATDTRATVHVKGPDKEFRRMVMHRYPERSQDFVPAPGDPSVGPMGRRTDPDPAVKLTYLDTSKAQFHVVADRPDAPTLRLLVRLPGQKPFQGLLEQNRFPIGQSEGREFWLHVVERIDQAAQVMEPTVTPKTQRNPKDEGTYIHALLPVDLEMPLPGQDTPWRQRVWLTHMRYPTFPDGPMRPETLTVPGLGAVEIAFSRKRQLLPFALSLEAFEMQPYEGTDIPRDYLATLNMVDMVNHQAVGEPVVGVARLNNPLVYHGIKLSQVGWDPGNKADPNRLAKDDQGRYVNQQRFTIMGVGNNVGIRVIFIGGCLISLGIPWAFYVKPLLLRRQKRKIQEQLAREGKLPGKSVAA